MKFKNIFLFVVSLVCFATGAKASPVVSNRYSDPLDGKTVALTFSLSSLTKVTNAAGVAAKSISSDESAITKALELYKKEQGLAASSTELSTGSNDTDELGIAHSKYQQTLQGVPVFGAQVAVHVNHARDSLNINGRLSRGALPDVIPEVTKDEASSIVDSDWTHEYGSAPDFHYEPKLWVLDVGLLDELVSGGLFLVYEVNVGSKANSVRYFVDAKNKRIVHKIALSAGATYRWVNGALSCWAWAASNTVIFLRDRSSLRPTWHRT